MTHSLARTLAYTLLLSSTFLNLNPAKSMFNEQENLENSTHVVKKPPLKSDTIGTEVSDSDIPASSLGGAEIPTEVEEQVNGGFFNQKLEEISPLISRLPNESLIPFALTNQTNRQLVHQFLMNDITKLVGHYHSLKNVVMMEYGAEYTNPDPREVFRLSRIKDMKFTDNADNSVHSYRDLLDQTLASGFRDDKGARQNFTIVPKSSPLARYIPNRDIAQNTLLSQALTTESYQELRKGLKMDVDLPSLQHALSRYKVFSGSGKEINQEILIQKAREILEVSNSLSSYLSLDQVLEAQGEIEGNYLSLLLENYNQLLQGDILRTFFKWNMDATLVLDINLVSIDRIDLPDFVKRLALTNSQQNLKEISRFLINNNPYLTHFDCSGLSLVESIGHGFLYSCPSLTHFDGSGLTFLNNIGGGFLSICTSLTHFDTSGLMNLARIESSFLDGCTSLPHFDSSGLTALKTIGTHFLEKCTSLNDLDRAKFIELINKNKEN